MVRRIFLTMSLVLVVAACSGGDDATTSSTPDRATTTTGSTDGPGDPDPGDLPTPDPASDESGVGAGESLADFFGGIDFSDDPLTAAGEAHRVETEIQERIRRCMAERGFEYLPVLPPEGAFTFAPEDQREFAEAQGFGITTLFGDDMLEETEEWVDPNQAFIDAMPESEQEAYFEALHGSPEDQETVTEVDPETGEEIIYSEGLGDGCTGEAYEAVYGDQDGQSEMWEELGPELEDMYARMEADPRIVAVNEEWSACMAEAGHEYASRSDMYEQAFTDLQARFDEIVGPDGDAAAHLEGIDREALTALQEEEIALAVSDVDCAGDHDDVHAEVTREYESEFIAEHRVTLEDIVGPSG